MSALPITTSRREIIKLGAMSASFASGLRLFSHTASSTLLDTFQGLKVGLTSYSTRKFSLDETLRMVKRLALRYISLKDFHLPLKSTSEERRAAAQKIKQAGLQLLGCGVVTMKNDEAEIRQAFDYAQDAGIATIVASPDPAALGLLDRLVKDYNIRIAIHNHGPEDKHYPTPDSVAEAVKDYDRRIGLCIDIGHTMRAGVKPEEAIRKHAGRLYELHLKDVDKAAAEGRNIELGRGVIDIPAVLRALLEIKYPYHVALEYEKDADDPLPGMAESIGYLRGVLAMM